ncbi:aspartate aminotransferase family protein [Lichenifustis flavocetrariae]|uniref:Aminotransferase class III-fold pyridoxal phosphate-dependent enzyme n=1 Tax=Lichenifustis flavocetrariae TaxID=2949735 RepID=A0AA42CGY6_9HYPH|nr:aminotransferase class III-fold pyridoxal phosphate-dependent enzyme [Lichenifustis flavocetrariae]MCW6506709.1 aminotransferase class III-fold pyridoxal phosphate-dependent enzyme [Lichenifustis flavocetrariae]
MAATHLVGGISSAGRSLPGEAFSVQRAAGPYLWDTDNRRYIDTALGFGGTILGHAPPTVIEAAQRALRDGPLPAFAHRSEEAAAAALAAHAGALTRVVFTNSGSEAVHLACRIARACTGRSRVVKMAAGYDGWYDDQAFGNAGSMEAHPAANHRPDNGSMVLARFNDLADAEAVFAERTDIAGIIVEPMMANAGCIMPAPGYLEHLQTLARRHGALLIADEVLMGFRLHAGLTSHRLGLDPDLATVGKAIGSGMAVAAVLGRLDVMRVLEDGRANRAGTYSGNPVACAAVNATLAELDQQDYPALLARGDALRSRFAACHTGSAVEIETSGYGTVFTIWPGARPTNYTEALAFAQPTFSLELHHAMRARGVIVMPQCFGRVYMSFSHGPEEIDALAAAFQAAVAVLPSET